MNNDTSQGAPTDAGGSAAITTTDSGEVVVSINDVSKRYGRQLAVDSLSLEVRRGELFALLGPNGAGKTTTFGMLLGLVRPTAGNIELFGRRASDVVPLHRRVGALLEHPAFLDALSARTNLEYLARPHGKRARARIDEVLRMVGLDRRARDRVRTYSQGMKQRLGLAAALLHDPELLILDEPTNGLDPEGSDEIWSLLRRLVSEEGKTLIVSSHLLHEIEAACDRVALLRRGRLVACEPIRGLMAKAAGGTRRVRLGFATDGTATRAREILASRQSTQSGEQTRDSNAPVDSGGTETPPPLGEVEPGQTIAPGGFEFEAALGGDAATSIAAIIDSLSESGCTPIGVVPVRPSLKELFLRLTG